jgi:hypothetical protein
MMRRGGEAAKGGKRRVVSAASIVGMSVLATISIPAAGASSHTSSAPVGIGSTPKEWAGAYGKDQGICVDCYGPLVHNDSGKHYMYSGAEFGHFTDSGFHSGLQANDLALDYTLNTAAHTSWDVVQRDVMRMLPKDAVLSAVTVDHEGTNDCGVFTATSATLARIKAMKNPLAPDYPTGVVQVSMSMLDHYTAGTEVYDPNNVQTTSINVGETPPTEACEP